VSSILINGREEWGLPGELLERGLTELLKEESVEEAEISVTFLDDKGIQALNEEYLERGEPTDVIAFALHDSGEAPLGDVYVGFEQALEHSRALGIPLEEELLRLAVHGALHVLGYTHPEDDGREGSPMYLRQEELLGRILSAESD
jgi:probable rRNA maturation factor